MKKKFLFFALALTLAIAGCGPSPEEVATMTASAWTPTPAPTPTATPLPYDLTLKVTATDGSPISGANVTLDGAAPVATDANGAVSWTNLPAPDGTLTISAQGFFASSQPFSLNRGPNDLTFALERDPFGVLPAEACGAGESLLYMDDFQDGEAQGWNFSYNTNAAAHYVGSSPDAETNSVLTIDANKITYYGGDAYLGGNGSEAFGDAVWRMKFMVSRPTAPSFVWRGSGPLELDGQQFTHAQYGVYFPGGISQVQMNRMLEGGPNVVVSNPRLTTASFVQTEMQWYQMELSTYQGQIQLWIDGKKVMEYTDAAPLPPGNIGIFIGAFTEPSTTALYFDNISVCGLSAPFASMFGAAP